MNYASRFTIVPAGIRLKHFLLSLCVLVASHAYGQQKDSATYGWKHNMVAGLTLTQVAFTDWVQGGENALAYTFSAAGKSVDEEERMNLTSMYKFAFGQTRLGNQGLRKTDDIIDLSTVLTYKLGTSINPYGAATLKTQFAKGFMYDVTGSETQVSKFFDPAYLTQSAGAGYQSIKEFRTRLGAALREVVTDQFNQYVDDPTTTEVEKTSVDGGLESVSNVDWQMEDNILFTTQLELFAPFKRFDEVVVRSTTAITGKVNKYITAIFNLQLVNEKRISPRTQVKESIALGLSYTIF
ncbi:MAG: DUF3078 domain-containing protein [Ignavibacteriae bacterium]|nr:DUF3078 domain-containing protein [Ignavibacteria bacterium]MBI3364010.1 DUF3078 domain-containing protein [Ignavibacteriota bacterium]